MQISVTDAKAQLTDLLRRAEAGEKIVLTRHGQPVVRLVAIKAAQNRKARRAMVEALREVNRRESFPWLSAGRYDLLFGECLADRSRRR